MTEPKFTVAISGGGIAGVMTALAITHFTKERKDIKVNVYESKASFTEIGAGIGFTLRPWRIMKAFGLTEELEALLDEPRVDFPPSKSFLFRKSDRSEGVSFYELLLPNGMMGFHRAQFLDVITGHLDPEVVTSHFSKRLVSYEGPKSPDQPITLTFADGSTATADVLIGCDGIQSATRRSLLEFAASDLEASGQNECNVKAKKLRESVEPTWSGRLMYRAIISKEKLETVRSNHRALERPVVYTGKRKTLTTYPIANHTLVNVVASVAWPEKAGTRCQGKTVEPRSQAEVLQHFEGWEGEVQDLLKFMDNPSCWTVNTVDNLPISTHGRVALAGDSAHAMTPFQGSGAGQAVEDAYILARILAHPSTTLKTVGTALKVYEEIRLPHAIEVQRRSAMAGDISCFHDPRFADLANVTDLDPGKLWAVGHALVEIWTWAWVSDIKDDEDRAMKLLGERLIASQ